MKLYGGSGKRRRRKRFSFKNKLSNKNRIIIGFVMVLIAVGMTVTALAVKYVKPPEFISPKATTADNQQNSTEVVPDGSQIEIDDNSRKADYFTVLLAGTDNENWNTDTIMLASFDIVAKKLNVVSIPRDTMVNVRRSNKKLNSAYTVGGKSGNIDELMDEVKSVVGFRPDRYVIVTLNGFIEMIDAIGGVTVDVPIDMIYEDPAQDLKINIKKGIQNLDGYDAMGFMRYRHTYVLGDIGRIKVQHSFIEAFVKKMITPATLSKLPKLSDIAMRNVKTDLTTGNLIWLGKECLGLNSATDISFYTLPGEGQYYKRVSYYMVYENAALEMINEFFNPYISPIKKLNLPKASKEATKSSGSSSTLRASRTKQNAKSIKETQKSSTATQPQNDSDSAVKKENKQTDNVNYAIPQNFYLSD